MLKPGLPKRKGIHCHSRGMTELDLSPGRRNDRFYFVFARVVDSPHGWRQERFTPQDNARDHCATPQRPGLVPGIIYATSQCPGLVPGIFTVQAKNPGPPPEPHPAKAPGIVTLPASWHRETPPRKPGPSSSLLTPHCRRQDPIGPFARRLARCHVQPATLAELPEPGPLPLGKPPSACLGIGDHG